MIEKPSIQQLENFVIYGRVRNYSMAAHMANITQSAFSFQMKKLEEVVGVQLIARSNRGSDLTREGEFFLQRVERIMSDMELAINELRDYSKQCITLNVGVLMSTGDVLMNKHVSYFQTNNDNIRINIYNLEAKSMLGKLDSGELDIATAFILPQMSLEGYVKKFLVKEELVYYAPKLDLPKQLISVEQIAHYPMVIYSPDYFMTTALRNYFQSEGVEELNIQGHLSTPYAIVHYCNNNRTGALLSRSMLDEIGVHKGVYTLQTPLYFDTFLLYKNENPKIKGVEYFVDHILEMYRQDKKTTKL